MGGDGSQVETWLRNKNTLEFLAVWETINNMDFNSHEFVGIRNESGTNRFNLSVKEWIGKTTAKGIVARPGRYGGTYADKEIALEFASWLSPSLRLYVIKEFQRLKADEDRHGDPEWAIHRTLAKVNYRLHTDAIKKKLIPPSISKREAGFIYATEADLVNKAVIGITAKEWRSENPEREGNLRDNLSVEQLLVLANIENYNSILIDKGFPPDERLLELNARAREQLKTMTTNPTVKTLKVPPLLDAKKN